MGQLAPQRQSEPTAPAETAAAADGGRAPTPPESRTAKFAWAAGLGWCYQGLVFAVGVWLTRFLVARLGDRVLGWWAQAVAVVGYLGLIDFGLSAMLPREVAAAVGRAGGWARAADLPGVLARFVRFALWQFPPAVGVAAACFLVLTRGGEAPVAATAGLVAAATLAYPFRVGPLVLTGLQDVRFAGAVQPVVYLAGVGVTVGAVVGGFGPAGLVASWAVQAFLVAALTWGRLAVRYRPALPAARDVLAARVPRRMLADGTWAWLAGVGVGLAGTAELVVIGWFEPPETVFKYACTVKLVTVLAPVVLTLCAAAVPGLTELRAAGDAARVGRAALAYTQLALGVSGMVGCVLLAVNSGFVGWWVGAHRYLGDRVAWAAIVGMNVRHGLNAIAVTLFCLHRERALWRLTLLDGVVSFAATAGWVAWGGAAWAPLGPLTAAVAVTLPLCLRVVWAEGTVPVGRLARAVGGWAALYAGLAGLAALAGKLGRPAGPAAVALVGAAAAGVYVLVMAGPALRAELGDYLRPRLRWLGL